jgi:arylsulfatase A-like enzyme
MSVACCGSILAQTKTVTQNQKPKNIIFILADDLGYGDLGCYGAKPEHVRTPNIDGIARDGIRFTDGHSPASVSCPSRYNLMTGRYSWRTWAETGNVWANDPMLIDIGQMTIASLLKEGGYYTGMIGKWHLGFGKPGGENWDDMLGVDFNKKIAPGPRETGFDYFYGMPATGQHPNIFIENYTVDHLEADDPIKMTLDSRPEFLTTYDKRPRTYDIRLGITGGKKPQFDFDMGAMILTAKVVSFIDEHHDKPFFLYYAPRNVHAPIRPHPMFKGTSGIGVYGDFIHELDWSVGELLKTLEKYGLTDDTLIIFASDNVAVSEGHRPAEYVNYNGHMSNGPLRGQKTEIWEGGHRVPFIAKWTKGIKPSTVSNETIATTDMLATFAALTGKKLPHDAGQDSFNLLPAFIGAKTDNKPLRPTMVNDSRQGIFSIRQGPWKLVFGDSGGGIGTEKENIDFNVRRLYNLDDDLGELNNVIDKHPDIVKQLTALFEDIRTSGRSR